MDKPKTAEQLNREAGVTQSPRFDNVVHQEVDWLKVNEDLRHHLVAALKQARREMAESIFADLYELLEGYHPGYVASRLFVSKLAELKAKYLGK